jgi:hypothetical protein
LSECPRGGYRHGTNSTGDTLKHPRACKEFPTRFNVNIVITVTADPQLTKDENDNVSQVDVFDEIDDNDKVDNNDDKGENFQINKRVLLFRPF